MNWISRVPTRWQRWAPYLISLGAGVIIFSGLISLGRPARIAITREVKRDAAHVDGHAVRLTCQGGMEAPAKVTLVPDAVVTTEGRETVEYHAEIDVRRGKAVGLAWEAQVIDDRGRKVSSALAAGTARAKAGDTTSTGAILPNQLPDGFYMLRVRVAVSPGDAASTMMEAVQYFNINGGKWREMDDVQWRADSNATLAFRATTQQIAKGRR